MKARWHILREGETLTLARHLPARFDLFAETDLPEGSALRYAHQIRQDMWRRLQRVRGFSPVVRLHPVAHGWRVRAGGRVAGPVPSNAVECLAALLETPAIRERWARQAQRKVAGVGNNITQTAETIENKYFTTNGLSA